MDIEMLRERARIIRQVRAFFDVKDYLELDTPLLSPDLIPESCLDVFETKRITPGNGSTPYWLIPSPEIWMKKIIARHHTNVYQICKCFRNGESSGFLHSPEFTMLEYYTMNTGYLDSLALTEELFRNLAANVCSPNTGSLNAGSPFCISFERITVAEAFFRYAGFDLFAAVETPGGLEKEAIRLGLDLVHCAGKSVATLYDMIFIHAVEPKLKQDRPIALLDYPAFVPTLARKSADGKTVERWELYFNGIELANCYSEETDPGRVRDFFESEAKEKEQQAAVKHKVDHDYWKIFEKKGFPACSGVALGLDRLIMALCGRSSIDGVLPFTI
jgi:lysyl-tRNA synthetase class 2